MLFTVALADHILNDYVLAFLPFMVGTTTESIIMHAVL